MPRFWLVSAAVAVDIGAGWRGLAHQADDSQIVLDVVVGHSHDPQAVQVAVLGEALDGGDVLVGHGEGIHLRVVLGEGAEAAVRGTRVVGVADLGEQHGGIARALPHDVVGCTDRPRDKSKHD